MGALLHLTKDANAVNAVVNHPAIRPFVGEPEAGDLDLSPLMARPENLFPFGAHGGFALIWTAPHAREVHTFILPEGRGKWAREAAREGIEMARQCGTQMLWTRIPPHAPNVRAYATIMGMAPTGEEIEVFGSPWPIYCMEVH